MALDDAMTELGERLADPPDTGRDLLVQAHGRAAEGMAQGDRYAQGPRLAGDCLRVGLWGRGWRVEVLAVAAAQDVEHEGGIGHGSCERADAGQAVEGLAI